MSIFFIHDEHDFPQAVGLSLEHVPGRDDDMPRNTFQVRNSGRSAGGDNDEVGLFGQYGGHVGFALQTNLHAQFAALKTRPAGGAVEVLPSWSAVGDERLPAESVAPFQEHDRVPPRSRNAGSFEAGGTAPHDDDAFFTLQRGQFGPIELAPDGRVLNAGHTPSGINAVNAPFVVPHALADVVERLHPGLVRQVRVGDEGAVHDAQVGLTFGDQPVRLDGVHHSSRHDDRHIDDLTNARREIGVHPQPKRHVGDGCRFADIRLGRTADHIEVVEQLPFRQAGADLLHGGVVQASFDHVVASDANAHDEVAADALANGFDNAGPEAEAVGQLAPVLIGAAIDVGSPELVNQMAMAGHHFTAIEASLLQATRCGGERRYELVDRLLVEGMRVFAVIGLADGAGAVHSMPQVDATAASAAVRDLSDDGHVVTVHRLAELLEIRDDAVFEQFHAVPVAGRAGGMHTRRAEAHHEAHPADGFFLVVAAFAVAGHAVFGQRVGMRAATDAVLDEFVTDVDRREQEFEIRHERRASGRR